MLNTIQVLKFVRFCITYSSCYNYTQLVLELFLWFFMITLCKFISGNRHRIEPGVWNSKLLSYYNDKQYNIRDAIDYWYNLDSDESVSFREKCSGPQCSGSCPEKIALIAQGEAQTWSTSVRVALTACVVLIEVTCLIMKVNSTVM